MAITFDTSGNATQGSVLPTVEVAFTPGAGDNMVLIAVHAVNRAGYTSSGVVYDPAGSNVSMTLLDTEVTPVSYHLAVYILTDGSIAKSTEKTIRGTLTSGSARQVLVVNSFTADDVLAYVSGSASSSADTAGVITQTVSTAIGDMVVDAIAALSETPTPDASQTARGENGDGYLRTSSKVAAGSSEDMEWTVGTNRALAQIAIVLREGGGGGSAVPLIGPGLLSSGLIL